MYNDFLNFEQTIIYIFTNFGQVQLPNIPALSSFWVQDQFLAVIKQVYAWYWNRHKAGIYLVLPQVITSYQATAGARLVLIRSYQSGKVLDKSVDTSVDTRCGPMYQTTSIYYLHPQVGADGVSQE